MNKIAPIQTINDEAGKPRFAVIAWQDYKILSTIFENMNDNNLAALSDEDLARLSSLDQSAPTPSSVVEADDAGSRLKAWRIHKRYSQEELAHMADFKGKQYIYELESNRKKGTLKTWQALATALKINLDDLI